MSKRGLAEGPLDGLMVGAGAFDGNDHVAQIVLPQGLANAIDGGPEIAGGVRQGGRFQQRAAIEIGEQIARPRLGAVDGHDAEVFGADSLDAWGEIAGRLLQQEPLARFCRTVGAGT